MKNEQIGDGAKFGVGLRIIRHRRRYLLGAILAYLPAMWTTMQLNRSYRALGTVFVVWFILLFIAAIVSAVARCPRCGNYFHMHGMTLLFFRNCLHCQLHINADK